MNVNEARLELAQRVLESLYDDDLNENRFLRLLRPALAGAAFATPLAGPGTAPKAVKPTKPAVQKPSVDDSWKDAKYQERRLKAMKDPNDTLMQMSKRYGVPYDELYKRTYVDKPKYKIPSLEDRQAQIAKEEAQKKITKQAVRNVLDRYYRRNPLKPKFRGDTGEGDLPKGTQPEDMGGTGETRRARNFKKSLQYNIRGARGLEGNSKLRNYDLTTRRFPYKT